MLEYMSTPNEGELSRQSSAQGLKYILFAVLFMFCSQNVGTPFKTQPDREFEANLNSVSASSAKKPRLDYNKDN